MGKRALARHSDTYNRSPMHLRSADQPSHLNQQTMHQDSLNACKTHMQEHNKQLFANALTCAGLVGGC